MTRSNVFLGLGQLTIKETFTMPCVKIKMQKQTNRRQIGTSFTRAAIFTIIIWRMNYITNVYFPRIYDIIIDIVQTVSDRRVWGCGCAPPRRKSRLAQCYESLPDWQACRRHGPLWAGSPALPPLLSPESPGMRWAVIGIHTQFCLILSLYSYSAFHAN